MHYAAGFNYFDVMGMAKKGYDKLLEPVGRKWELTRNELDVLLFLYNNPEFNRAADIVARRGMAKSHVSLSVTRLESCGLLERHFDEKDRRTAHLVLMPQGKEIAAEAKAQQEVFFSALYRNITPEEFRMWGNITRKVCENIENFNNTLINE